MPTNPGRIAGSSSLLYHTLAEFSETVPILLHDFGASAVAAQPRVCLKAPPRPILAGIFAANTAEFPASVGATTGA